MVVLLVAGAASLAYKYRNKDKDDEFAKVEDDSSSFLSKLKNPFKRKDDKDDDFDKVL